MSQVGRKRPGTDPDPPALLLCLSAAQLAPQLRGQLSLPVESKTRTHNGRVGSARRTADGGAGRSWAEQGADISVNPEASYSSGPSVLGHALHDLSSPKPGHTTGASGRHGARRTAGQGEARQNRVLTFRSARKATIPLAFQGTVNNCSERLFASTNKGNPM